MLKPRVVIRSLRHASLILIALPEPVTTVIGAVLLGITFYISHALSKIIEKSLSNQARERLTSYLAHFRRFGNEPAAVAVKAKERRPEPIRLRKTEEGELKADLRSSILLASDGQPKSAHHTIDHIALARFYSIGDDSEKVSYGATLIRKAKLSPVLNAYISRGDTSRDSFHHAINRENLYRRYGQQESFLSTSRTACGFVPQKKATGMAAKTGLNSHPAQSDEPAVHHAVNMKHLQKRYSPEGRKSPPKVYREGFDLLGVFSSF